MIGDGMGISQITAGLYANGASLNLEKFQVTGLIKTHSAKQMITDSGAGATAFFDDASYEKQGAQITDADTVLREASLLAVRDMIQPW